MLTMFNFKNLKSRFAFYLLLTLFVNLYFILSISSHPGKHNIIQKGSFVMPISFFTVHSGLDFDRWADPNKPIFISSNLHPLGKYQLRDVEWTDGFKRKFWNPQPPGKIKFWLRAYVTGFGHVDFSDFKATVYGQTFGPKVTERDKVSWHALIGPDHGIAENVQVDQYLEGPKFITTPGTYNWTASGKVKLIPVHYALGGSVSGSPGINFGWTMDTSLAPTEYSGSGSWVVEHRVFKRTGNVDKRLSGNYRCAGCSEKVSSQYAHRITCASPYDPTQYYFCLQTEKWTHLYEETCSNANCADTGVYRCSHIHSDPSPPPPDPEPPDVAGSCGHTFPITEIANHEPSVGSCGHTYSPCTPGDHTLYVCNISPCSNRVWWGCISPICPESSNHGTTTTIEIEPQMHVCGVHESWQSGDHAAAACGISTHFACDGLTHVQEQCTITNANGDRCTYTFWRCLHPTVPSYGPSHGHTYPRPRSVACGSRGWTGCSAAVGSRNEHQTACSNCSVSYWTCNPEAIAWHVTVRTCTRSGCGATYTNCTKDDGMCSGGRYIWHN